MVAKMLDIPKKPNLHSTPPWASTDASVLLSYFSPGLTQVLITHSTEYGTPHSIAALKALGRSDYPLYVLRGVNFAAALKSPNNSFIRRSMMNALSWYALMREFKRLAHIVQSHYVEIRAFVKKIKEHPFAEKLKEPETKLVDIEAGYAAEESSLSSILKRIYELRLTIDTVIKQHLNQWKDFRLRAMDKMVDALKEIGVSITDSDKRLFLSETITTMAHLDDIYREQGIDFPPGAEKFKGVAKSVYLQLYIAVRSYLAGHMEAHEPKDVEKYMKKLAPKIDDIAQDAKALDSQQTSEMTKVTATFDTMMADLTGHAKHEEHLYSSAEKASVITAIPSAPTLAEVVTPPEPSFEDIYKSEIEKGTAPPTTHEPD